MDTTDKRLLGEYWILQLPQTKDDKGHCWRTTEYVFTQEEADRWHVENPRGRVIHVYCDNDGVLTTAR